MPPQKASRQERASAWRRVNQPGLAASQRRVKQGPAQASAPLPPQKARAPAQVLRRRMGTRGGQPMRRARPVRQRQTETLILEEVEAPPRQTVNRLPQPVQQRQTEMPLREEVEAQTRQMATLPPRPVPRCQRGSLALLAVSPWQKVMPCCPPSPREASEPEWRRQRGSSGTRTLVEWAWKQPLHHPCPHLQQRTVMPARPTSGCRRSARTLCPSAEAPLAGPAAKPAPGTAPGRRGKSQTPAPPACHCAAPPPAKSAGG